ncbi:dihydroxyacetone kinase subunit DhaL [Nocardia macrotermitis]|uniref:PTS-dependent dihydroxyacetone kinase, ADP-binding subunit DhaL n=1 Tax=Nocardia macrotermitis TaxID=2585198 RepID=A0A7K0CTY8_9NOCA|nr:dihydroxyacetone kinase subunit DhaL [Nocardia macrotermitis]MQY16940.1 PTS-dependent dihydroxyacetone kinase, ADP-binding subunit DhaL [Nocardia macrotermitis]
MTENTARTWILGFADRVITAEPQLTAYDQAAGDGDFGNNIGGAVALVRTELAALPENASAREVLTATANVFLDRVGGTSGPLFGLLFQALSRAVGETLTPATLAEGAAEGLAAIQRVGEAQVGDKTLVDALSPAVDALRALAPDTNLDKAFDVAATAAVAGARSTRDIRARRGRASYVGDHAIGVPDPGAITIGLLFGSSETG